MCKEVRKSKVDRGEEEIQAQKKKVSEFRTNKSAYST